MDRPQTRRRFLQQTFAFSATAALAGCGSGLHQAASLVVAPAPAVNLHLLAVGDWGIDADEHAQSKVATAMQTYMAAEKFSPTAMLMLGDNFYGSLPGGENSTRWQTQFEQMYPASVFNCPFYGVFGNHDYQVDPVDKVAAELAYAAKGNTRWTMPSHYYAVTLPASSPLVTILFLDSNRPNEPAQPPPFEPSYYTPTAEEVAVQDQWFKSALAAASTPFVMVAAHHPVYSNGPHGDNATLIKTVDPLLHQHAPHFYLGGHDHDMQHLEFAGHPTSFVLSGGGGAPLVPISAVNAARGPYAKELHGFTHIHLQQHLSTVRFVDETGTVIHSFQKTPAGVLTLSTA